MPGGNPAPGPPPGAGKKGENEPNALLLFMDLTSLIRIDIYRYTTVCTGGSTCSSNRRILLIYRNKKVPMELLSIYSTYKCVLFFMTYIFHNNICLLSVC